MKITVWDDDGSIADSFETDTFVLVAHTDGGTKVTLGKAGSSFVALASMALQEEVINQIRKLRDDEERWSTPLVGQNGGRWKVPQA